MNNRHLFILPALTLILCLSALPAAAEVTVEPTGLIAALAVDSVQQTPIIFHNQGVADAAFAVDLEDIEQLGGRRDGPRRDEPGDLLAEFDRPQDGEMQNYYFPVIGWDWDNERMGVSSYFTGRIYWFTHDNAYENFELVATFNGPGQSTSMDGCWLNGVTYVQHWAQGLARYDMDGNSLGDINLGYACYAAAADVENNWLLAMDFNVGPPMIHVYQMDDDNEIVEQLGQFNDYPQYANNAYPYNLEWVPKHTDGKLWLTNGQNAYEIAVDEENWECTDAVQNFNVGANQPYDAVGHDGHNLWAAGYGNNTIRVYDDGIFEPYWFIVEPNEGVVAAGDDLEVTGVFNAEGVDPGTYEMAVTFFFYADDTSSVAMSAVLTVDGDAADIYGVITDAATTLPVASAKAAIDRYIYARYSDDDGNYRLPDLPLDDYTVTFSAPDFLPHTEAVDLNQAGDYELNVALLHAECTPDLMEIRDTLPPDWEEDHNIRVTNGGNGLLTWRIDKRLPGGANADPWTLRQSFHFGLAVNDTRIEGVVYADDRFYIAGGDPQDNDSNFVYIFNHDGEFIDRFPQPGSSRYGCYDLDWDGELIWGSGEQTVYGFTTEGNLQTQFRGPDRVNQSIAWDSDRGELWIAATASNQISRYNRAGELMGDISQFGLKAYGLAYWSDDPDNHPLYVFHQPAGDSVMLVYKIDPEQEDTLFVTRLITEAGGDPRGAFITNAYDVYSWVFMGVANDADDDRVDIWQLASNSSWMQVSPEEGQIAAGEFQDVTLTLNTADMDEGDYQGEIVFVHDGRGGETGVTIYLTVSTAPRPPGAFDLLEPSDGDSIRTSEVAFRWQESRDPDAGDTVRYELWFKVGDDSLFLPSDSVSLTIALDSLPDWHPDLPADVTWWVVAWAADDRTESNQRFRFVIPGLDVSGKQGRPAVFELTGAFPNPFNSVTRVVFSLPEVGLMSLSAYDVAGRRVADLTSGELAAGVHQITFDGSALSSGIYFLRLESAGKVAQQKLTLVK